MHPITHPIAHRYRRPADGRLHRRAAWDHDQRPGELATAIRRAQAGDPEAIRYLYLRFAPNVYGYARSIVRDEHEAEDVTQQVFARLLTAVARYQDRGVPFSAWLLRIAHNAAIDHVRRRVVLADESAVVDESDEQRALELGADLREALDALPVDQRRVLVLRHVLGWSSAEIAVELGRSEDAVHALHHRARRALRRALCDAGATPMVAAA
jgi:RNA polymerase sigma-70 factor (ECF subfamily)